MDLLKNFNYIDKVGLEIEGCWPKRRNDLIEDGSMRANEFLNPYTVDPDSGNKIALFGELLSPPLDSPTKVFKFLENNWVSETGRRCGFHVHVSLKNFDAYCACMSKDFYDGFVTKITEWGREHCNDNRLFWERLCNQNEYCCDVFIPDVQAAITKKTIVDRRRYCMFNYCWGMHKTIECRLFPTFLELERAIGSTNTLMQHFEDYLSEHFPKRKPLLLSDDLEDGSDKLDQNVNDNKPLSLPKFNLYSVTNDLFKVKPMRFSGLIERTDRSRPWEKPRKQKPIPDDIIAKIERREVAERTAQMAAAAKRVSNPKKTPIKESSGGFDEFVLETIANTKANTHVFTSNYGTYVAGATPIAPVLNQTTNQATNQTIGSLPTGETRVEVLTNDFPPAATPQVVEETVLPIKPVKKPAKKSKNSRPIEQLEKSAMDKEMEIKTNETVNTDKNKFKDSVYHDWDYIDKFIQRSK